MSNTQTRNRKQNHIDIVRTKDVEPIDSSLEKYTLPYTALPEINKDDIDTSINFFDHKISFPFLISGMTGGVDLANTININLAKACEEIKIPMGLGSMRIVLEDKSTLKSFQIKKYCPSIPIFANLGLVQLNYGITSDDINYLIDSVQADGIFLHINPLQEALQPEGDTNFKDLLPKLEKTIKQVHKPILIKEVGTGISIRDIQRLKDIGVDWVDISGLGGTNWGEVENLRRKDSFDAIFQNVGYPTDQCLIEGSKIPNTNLIAGGGIRSGVDIAKAIMLGAKMTTAAKPLLESAIKSPEATINTIKKFKEELEISMFLTGSTTIKELSKLKLLRNE